MSAETRIATLGCTLPTPAGGLGAYAPWTRTGSLVTTSGQFPWRDGALAYRGRIGADLSVADGHEAARLCALNGLAQLREACGGNLDRIRRIVRIEGSVLADADFTDHAAVLDGASELMNAVFSDAARHSRAVTGVASNPLGTPVLLYVQAEIVEAVPQAEEHRIPGLSDEGHGLNGRVGQQLVLETERVRVWSIRLAPGERLGSHTHVLDYFWTAVTAGRGRSRKADGTVHETEYKAGDTRVLHFEAGQSMTHDLENIGDTELLFTTVEFLDSANEPLPLGGTSAGQGGSRGAG